MSSSIPRTKCPAGSTNPEDLKNIPVFEASPVVYCHNNLGEGIVWDDVTNKICWIDIETPKFWQYDPVTREVTQQDLPERPGAIALCDPSKVSPNTYVIAFQNGPAFYNLTTGKLKRIFEFEPYLNSRINDSRVDRQGRFIMGGYHYDAPRGKSNVYRLNTDLSVELLIRNVAVANSTCWSLDGRTMFFTDSRDRPRKIVAYDYDARENTALTNRRNFVVWPEDEFRGVPDGSIVDADGYLWNAEHANGRVLRYDPNGNVTMIVNVPEKNTTCCAFGGANMDTLFITTKWRGLPEGAETDPLKGTLYAVKIPGVRGVKEDRFGGTEYGLRRTSKL